MRFALSLVLLTALASCAPRCPLQITSRMPAVRMPRSPPSRCGLMSSRSAASWRAIAKSGRAPAATSSRLISAYRPPFRLRRRCVSRSIKARLRQSMDIAKCRTQILPPALRSKRSINLLSKTKGCGSHWAAAGRALQAQFPCVTAAKTAMPIRRSCASPWRPKGPLATPAQYRPKPALHGTGVQIRQNHPPQSPRASAA